MTLNFFDRLAAVAVQAPGEVRPRQPSRFEQLITDPLAEEVDPVEHDSGDQPTVFPAPAVAPSRSITAPTSETRPDPTPGPQPTPREKESRNPSIVTAGDDPHKGSERRPLTDKSISVAAPSQPVLPKSTTTNQPWRNEQSADGDRFKEFGEADSTHEMVETSESRSTTINYPISEPTTVEAGVKIDDGDPFEPLKRSAYSSVEFDDPLRDAGPVPLISEVQPRPAAPAWPVDAERPGEGEAAAAAQPIIEISIGRIELRPPPAGNTAAQPTRPRFQPTVSLDDYLAQRRGESR